MSKLEEVEAEVPKWVSAFRIWEARESFKISEVSELLGVHHSSVRKLIALGELKSIVKLRHHLIPKAELVRFLNSANASK